MKTRIIINGAEGRMGKLSTEAIQESKIFEIVALCDIKDSLKDKILELKPDIVLDFTLASAVYSNAKIIIESGSVPVIGTSGLTEIEVEKLAILCKDKDLGGIIVPNFCLTAVLMMKFSKAAAKYMKNVEILEYHHDKKQDAPSGTAVRTAELISENNIAPRNRGHEMIKGSLGGNYKDVPIHSVRLPGFLAHQEVIFGEIGELLTIRADTTSRESFKKGIVLACTQVINKDKLHYGLENFLED
ncbi:MAG TPA: 4-hydroxy-tetrahydrodipicolinate reductase [Victivallales bacterium]|nr:4-hydroxy-tetrahydrodipicolinate reductase [Victivallales bacterium]